MLNAAGRQLTTVEQPLADVRNGFGSSHFRSLTRDQRLSADCRRTRGPNAWAKTAVRRFPAAIRARLRAARGWLAKAD